jgi:hypothetical protein
MPDNQKQGRSNKAMTFFVCFLAALAGLLFGLDIGVIAGALPFLADEFQHLGAHPGVGGQLYDVSVPPSVPSAAAGSPSGSGAKRA